MEPQRFQEMASLLEKEIQSVIVGHEGIIRKVLIAFFAGGTCCWKVFRDWGKPF